MFWIGVHIVHMYFYRLVRELTFREVEKAALRKAEAPDLGKSELKGGNRMCAL